MNAENNSGFKIINNPIPMNNTATTSRATPNEPYTSEATYV